MSDKEKITSTKEKSYVAEAINPIAADIELLSKMTFAEDAMGGPSAWQAVSNVALNRLKDGRYGKNLTEVVHKMSSAIRTKSPQWQKVDSGKMNPFEQLVYDRINKEVTKVMSKKNVDNTKGAVLFENIDKYGFPKTWDKSKVQAVAKVGRHTYFKEK